MFMVKRVFYSMILLSLILLLSACNGPETTYKSAQSLLSKGQYEEAGDKFRSIGSYEDASLLAAYCNACALCEAGNYEEGIAELEVLGDFKDSSFRVIYYTAHSYETLAFEYDWEKLINAQEIYREISGFLDSKERVLVLDKRITEIKESQYQKADMLLSEGMYSEAIDLYSEINDYKDANSKIEVCQNRAIATMLKTENTQKVMLILSKKGDSQNVAAIVAQLRDELKLDRFVIASDYCTYGMSVEGMVVATGYNDSEQCNTQNWGDIIKIIASDTRQTVGLKSDGSVVAIARIGLMS